VVLGFLSHPIYLAIIASFGFWFFFDRLRSTRNALRAADASLRFFLPTLVLLAALFVSMALAIAKEGMAFGGGGWIEGSKLIGYAIRIGRLLFFEFGIPLSVSLPLVVITFLLFTVSTIAILIWRGDSRAWFYLATVMLVPAGMFVSKTPIDFDSRHFLLTGVPLLLLTGQCLAWVTRINLTARAMAGVFLGLFVLGNSMHLIAFLEFGRGSYRSAVRLMEQQTTGPVMTVGGTNHFQTLTLLDYYRGQSSDDAEVHYVGKEYWGNCAPQWLIIPGHALAFDPAPTLFIKAPTMRETPELDVYTCPDPDDAELNAGELSYALKGVYRYWGLSGWHWALYGRS
jgi:hypothetical protein